MKVMKINKENKLYKGQTLKDKAVQSFDNKS